MAIKDRHSTAHAQSGQLFLGVFWPFFENGSVAQVHLLGQTQVFSLMTKAVSILQIERV